MEPNGTNEQRSMDNLYLLACVVPYKAGQQASRPPGGYKQEYKDISRNPFSKEVWLQTKTDSNLKVTQGTESMVATLACRKTCQGPH